ncbi:hypothetical protein G6F34_012273 [Rhizopus arrhizus]|nr:hypothetical protein G6F34_012273 [Rhizopus arrhizus]
MGSFSRLERDETVVNLLPSTESPSSIDLTAAATEIITAGAATTPTQSKKVKPVSIMYSYLEEKSIQDEPVHEEIKRHFNGIGVSSKLLRFRELCKQEATRGVELRSNIEEFLTEHSVPFSPRYNKDMFTKKFITPLLSPFLKETKYFKLFGNDEHSEGSKERRGEHGRIPDGGLKVVYKEYEQQILLMEIKSPKVINEDRIYHPDFTKLANLMKDEVDLMLNKDFPEDTPVFGVLLEGHYGRVLVMDLVYTKIHRLFEIGSFLLPHNTKDLNRLDDVFDTMVKSNEKKG